MKIEANAGPIVKGAPLRDVRTHVQSLKLTAGNPDEAEALAEFAWLIVKGVPVAEQVACVLIEMRKHVEPDFVELVRGYDQRFPSGWGQAAKPKAAIQAAEGEPEAEPRIVNGVLIDEFPELTWSGCTCKDWAWLYIPEDRGDLGHHPRCTAVQDFAKQPCAQDPKCQGADTDGHCVPCAARKVLGLPKRPDYSKGVPRSVVLSWRDPSSPVPAEAILVGFLACSGGCGWLSANLSRSGKTCSESTCTGVFVPIIEDEREPEVMFLLLKRGLYWRENYCGYTEHKAAAGRYMRADAAERCHSWDEPVSMIAEADAPENSREARGFQPKQANETQEPAHE